MYSGLYSTYKRIYKAIREAVKEDMVCLETLGALGGIDYTDITSFLLLFKGERIILDCGSFPPRFNVPIDKVLITHLHLDHCAALLDLNNFTPKSDEESKEESKIELYTNDEAINELIGVKQNLFKTITTKKTDDISGIKIDYLDLEHHNYNKVCNKKSCEDTAEHKSRMYIISDTKGKTKGKTKKEAVLFFGDLAFSTGALYNRKEISNEIKDFTKLLINKTKNLIVVKMVIECAFPEKAPTNALYGHIKPSILMELLKTLSEEAIISVKETEIHVMHMKPSIIIKHKTKTLSVDYSVIKTIQNDIKKLNKPYKFNIKFPEFKSKFDPNSIIKYSHTNNINKEVTIDIYKPTTKSDKIKDLIPMIVLTPGVFQYDGDKNLKLKIQVNQNQMKVLQKYMNNKFWPNIFLYNQYAKNEFNKYFIITTPDTKKKMKK